MKPKTARLRLTLNVEFALNGESVDDLKKCLEWVVYDAYDNGTLAGETLATVKKMNCSVEEIEGNKPQFYIVTTKVWNCEGYCLEKGDRVELMERRMDSHLVKIYNSSFMTPLWVTETEFNLHCTPKKMQLTSSVKPDTLSA